MAAQYQKAFSRAVEFRAKPVPRVSTSKSRRLKNPEPFSAERVMAKSSSHTIVLYDGVCGLCNGLNQFLLQRDTHDCFRFASLQSDFATSLLRRHGVRIADLDTVYVVVDYQSTNERLLARSDAILHVLRQLGGLWSVFQLGRVIPKSLRNVVYDLVARNRYRIFGKYEVCLMPEERYRRKFLDITTSQ